MERKMNSNKSERERERERDAQPLQPSDATSRSWVFALNSVKPIAMTCEKANGKDELKAGNLF